MPARIKLHRAERAVIWVVCGALWTGAVAWLAFYVQQDGIAPVGLFSLAIGAIVGAGHAVLWRCAPLISRRRALISALVWGLLVVVAQDYIGHRRHLQSYEAAMAKQDPRVAMLVPAKEMSPQFVQFFSSRVQAKPIWWAIDLLFTSGAALAVTVVGTWARREVLP